MQMVHVASSAHEPLLRRPKEEDHRSPPAGHDQERGCSHFLCEPLLCKALRQVDRAGTPAGTEEAPRLQTEDGPERKEAFGSGPPRASSATLSERREFLEKVANVRVSDSTVSRALRRLGWSRKKIAGSGRARRVLEGSLACSCGRGGRRQAAGVRRRDGRQRIARTALYAWSPTKGERAFGSAPRNWGKNVTLLASITEEGLGPCLAVEGSTTREVFEAYLDGVLAPTLWPGQIVVMDNLSAHKGGRVKEIIEELSSSIYRLTRWTTTPSSRPSLRSRDCCDEPRRAPANR